MNAVTDTSDTAEFLDVDVDQLAGSVPLIPDGRLFGLQVLEPGQTVTRQDADHCGGGKADTERRFELRYGAAVATARPPGSGQDGS
jgi:hypothetical protein